jgi:hypothetical protein
MIFQGTLMGPSGNRHGEAVGVVPFTPLRGSTPCPVFRRPCAHFRRHFLLQSSLLMKRAFTAFAITVTLLMIVTAVVGVQVRGEAWFATHFALGLMSTLFICLCHCVVLAYFMATGKMMRVAIQEAALDSALSQSAQRLKIKAYAVLMPALLIALLAAFSGGWATINPSRSRIHLALIILSMLVQLAAFYREYTLIDANGRLMDDVFAKHEQARPMSGST